MLNEGIVLPELFLTFVLNDLIGFTPSSYCTYTIVGACAVDSVESEGYDTSMYISLLFDFVLEYSLAYKYKYLML
jgi:hypothetical protein